MSDQLSQCFVQLMKAQMGFMLAGSLIAGFSISLHHGAGFAFGAGLALINTVLSRRSIMRASALAYTQPEVGMLPIFSGLIQRLLVFAGGFVGGVLLLGLLPLPLMIGFALAQAGYLVCRAS